jgi:FKBP-type peptidyl-prolyl cis-trans isomerase
LPEFSGFHRPTDCEYLVRRLITYHHPMRILLLSLLFASTLAAQPIVPSTEAQKTASGLVTERLTAGSGTEHPGDNAILRLRYRLLTPEGKLLAKVEAPQDTLLPMWKMIAGWREAAAMMVVGESRRAWVTKALGAKVPAGSDAVVIDTELLEILPPPTTPPDVAAPPAGAVVKKSGLAFTILRPGSGTKHPSSGSTVTVHYSGWTTDGRMFDSSVARGEPGQFPMQGVIRGWQEMLSEMVPGERVRVWIPDRLAYSGERGKPKGMLVFEIELIDIQ